MRYIETKTIIEFKILVLENEKLSLALAFLATSRL